jgi:hypothetical protein
VVDSSGIVAGHCGIAVEPDGTGRISYRRSDTGALWYAGPESSLLWSPRTIYATASDAGRYVSLARTPDGRLGSAFYAYDHLSLGDVRMVVLDDNSVGAIRSVADSIATSAGAAAHIDLAVTSAGEWYIAFRNVDSTALYCASAETVVTGVGEGGGDDDAPDAPPVAFILNQNFPNPFNPRTTMEYSILETGLVNLSIFDVSGRLVRTLVNEPKTAGKYRTTWNARDNSGREVASGVYFVRLVSAGEMKTRKVVVIK